jgi:hypothetical protein
VLPVNRIGSHAEISLMAGARNFEITRFNGAERKQCIDSKVDDARARREMLASENAEGAA